MSYSPPASSSSSGRCCTNKGKRIVHVDPLPKGQSCSSCFKRKVRCSGERPACASCVRSAKFQGKDLSSIECDYTQRITGPRRRSKAKKAKKLASELLMGIKEEEGEFPAPLLHPNLLPPVPFDPLASIFSLFPDIYGGGESSWEPSSSNSSNATTPEQSPSLSVSDLDFKMLQFNSSPSSPISAFSPLSLDQTFAFPDFSTTHLLKDPLLFPPINTPNLFDQSFGHALMAPLVQQPEFLPLRPELVYDSQAQGGSLGEYEWARAILEWEMDTFNANQI